MLKRGARLSRKDLVDHPFAFLDDAALIIVIGVPRIDADHPRRVFVERSKAAALAQWNAVADRLRESRPKIAALMHAAREDVLAYMDFPQQHWSQIHSPTRSSA